MRSVATCEVCPGDFCEDAGVGVALPILPAAFCALLWPFGVFAMKGASVVVRRHMRLQAR